MDTSTYDGLWWSAATRETKFLGKKTVRDGQMHSRTSALVDAGFVVLPTGLSANMELLDGSE